MRPVVGLVLVVVVCFVGAAVGQPLAEDEAVNSLSEAEGLLGVDGQGHENESERKVRQFGFGRGFGGGYGGPFGGFGRGFGGGPFGGGFGRGFGGFGRGGFGHGGFGRPFFG